MALMTGIARLAAHLGAPLARLRRGETPSPPSREEGLRPPSSKNISRTHLLLLGSFAFVAFFFGLFQGFPHQELARYFLGLAGQQGGVGLSAASGRFDLPARLSYRNLVLVAETPTGPASLSVDQAEGALVLSSLATRNPRMNFRVRAYGGLFEGHLRRLAHSENHLKGATVTPVDLRLTEAVLHQKIGGTLALDTDYTWRSGAEIDGHGVVRAVIRHLLLSSLAVGGFPLPPVAFDAVRSQVFVSGGRGRLERLSATGPLADINGDGTFILATPYQNTVLHLRLNIHLKGALASIPFPGATGSGPSRLLILTLDGPAQNLTIAMNGIPIPH
ncbi:MAG: type II secretion system protein GspN [Leptospirillia bacterium]